jgi:membrane protein required for colicin V production
VLAALAPLDWICVAVLLVSLLVGAWRGLVVEVMSLVAWVAAFILAQWFAPDAAALLPMGRAAEPARYAAGFVLVFVATLFAGALIGFVVSKLLSAVGLGAINRLLGALFGALRGVVLILAATVVVGMTPFKTSPTWQASIGAQWATAALGMLKPVLPQEFGKYLPTT